MGVKTGHVAIAQGAAGVTELGFHATKQTMLVQLYGTMTISGTVQIAYADDAAGTVNLVALTGPMPVGTFGGFVVPVIEQPAYMTGAQVPRGKYLVLKTVTGAFQGQAVTFEPAN